MDELVSKTNDLPVFRNSLGCCRVNSPELRKRFANDAKIPVDRVAQPMVPEIIVDCVGLRVFPYLAGAVQHIAEIFCCFRRHKESDGAGSQLLKNTDFARISR